MSSLQQPDFSPPCASWVENKRERERERERARERERERESEERVWMSARVRRQAVYTAGPLNRAGRGAPTRPRERRNAGDTQKHAAEEGTARRRRYIGSAGSHN